MKSYGLILGLLLILLLAGCATRTPPESTGAPRLNRLVPAARQQAMEAFGLHATNLWFWSVTCQYSPHGFEDDATNELQWLTVNFFDPHSVERRPKAGNTRPTAMAYHVRLAPNGTLLDTSSGRTIGWKP